MAHPQNSPRGLFEKKNINAISELKFPVVTALPTTRVAGGFVIVNNSTGRTPAFHSTGTTWLFVNGTSVQT